MLDNQKSRTYQKEWPRWKRNLYVRIVRSWKRKFGAHYTSNEYVSWHSLKDYYHDLLKRLSLRAIPVGVLAVLIWGVAIVISENPRPLIIPALVTTACAFGFQYFRLIGWEILQLPQTRIVTALYRAERSKKLLWWLPTIWELSALALGVGLILALQAFVAVSGN